MSEQAWPLVSSIAQTVFGLIGVALGGAALFLASREILPLQPEIERFTKEQKRRSELQKALESPSSDRVMTGYDPRFNSREWTRLLAADGLPPEHIAVRLSRTHYEFHHHLDESLTSNRGEDDSDARHEHTTKAAVGCAIVDLLHVPRLLEEGVIAPLTGHPQLALDRMLDLRARLTGVRFDPASIAMMRALCSDEGGSLGALPLWINSQGRMIIGSPSLPGGDRISQISSFDAVLDHQHAKDLLSEAGVQSNHLIFEFWAHAKYRDCMPFEWSAKDRVLTSSLLQPEPNQTRERMAQSIADLAVRLQFFRMTASTFTEATDVDDLRSEHAFALEHAGEARMIRHGVALWKPVFSSELLWHALPDRTGPVGATLTDERDFRPPFIRHVEGSTWRYLGALGGYGLVLPAGAADDEDCWRTLKYAFLRNPHLMHPYLTDMLPTEVDATTPDDFVRFYARPRLSIWPDVESVLIQTLFQLMILLPKQLNAAPRSAWTAYRDFIARSPDATSCLEEHLETISDVVKAKGWTFVAT
jgi:hypothetical protein